MKPIRIQTLWTGLMIALYPQGHRLAAQDAPALPPVASYANSGPFAGWESFDVAREIGDGPGAILFVHVLNRNTAPVIRGFDQLAHTYAPLGLQGFTLMLSDDRTAAEEQLRRVNGSLRLHHPIALSLDGIEGPGPLALDRRLALTLIACANGKVTQRIEMNDTGAHDLEPIQSVLESALGGIPESEDDLRRTVARRLPQDPEALKALAAELAVALFKSRQLATAQPEAPMSPRSGVMRRPRSTQTPQRRATPRESAQTDADAPNPRRGAPPSDGELSGLLRSFIRQTNAPERLSELMHQIEARAAMSEELDQEAIAMFQLMLSFPERYGSSRAQEMARSFLRARNAE